MPYIQIIGSIVLCVFAVFWIVLPFILIEKFHKVIKQLSAIEDHLRMMRYNDEKARRQSAPQKELDEFRSRESI